MKLKMFLVVALALVASKAAASSCSAVSSGPCVAEIGTSTPTAGTTPVQVATGAGVINDIQLSSSTAAQIALGAFCVAFDSAPAVGSFTGTAESDGTATAPRLLTVQQTTINATTRLSPGPGTPFSNGLVVVCKGVARALAILSK